MDIIKKEINLSLGILSICVLVTVLGPIFLHNKLFILFGVLGIALSAYRYIRYQIILSKGNYYVLTAVCTDIHRQNALNYGVSRKCEFEPVEGTEYKDVFSLEIPDEGGVSLKRLTNRNTKIKIGYTYEIVFEKKKGITVPNTSTFLGYKRKSLQTIGQLTDEKEDINNVES